MSPVLLPENAGLAFLGETAWAPALVTARQASTLSSAPNACGRPNSDVMRRRLAVTNGMPAIGWQIDFPAHFTTEEAALYEQPFALLRQRSPQATWLNPQANHALRRVLARVCRWLATPANAPAPEWRWIEEDLLPDASLLVVARDEDFIQGVLQSYPFIVWWRKWQAVVPPDVIVGSFPFPWPPATALNALTATQEEQRHAIARAARSGDAQLNSAVAAAYGWRADLDGDSLLEKLAGLNRRRAV